VITDFGSDDLIDLTAADILYFEGYTPEPLRGGFGIWQTGGNTYVTWNTFGGFHDIELQGYTGDISSLYSQIRWYEDDFLANVNTTGRVAPDEAVTGAIEQPEDQDWFQITLSEGFLYTFDLLGEASGGGSLQDPHLVLYDADGNWVAEDWDGSGTLDARLLFAPDTGGTYYVSADGSGYTSGTYQLEVSARAYVDDYAGDASTTGEIAAGETRTGEIGLPADQDWFRIDLTEGQRHTIDLRGEASGAGTLPDPRLVLYDADGNWLAEDYDGSGTPDARLVLVANTSGTYYVSADGTGYTSGTYQLEVAAETYVDDFGDDTSTNGDIAVGEARMGEIGVLGDTDWFQIELTEGQTYAFDLRGADSGSGTLPDPVLVLYDAGGEFINGNDDWDSLDSHLEHTAAASGTFFLAAYAYGDSYTGTYELIPSAGTVDSYGIPKGWQM
jgi:hypothetical protein